MHRRIGGPSGASLSSKIRLDGPCCTERRQTPGIGAIIKPMVTRYLHEAMRRAQYKNLENGSCFGEIPGLSGVWANEPTSTQCRQVLQEVLEEWLVLKIRDGDPIPNMGRVRLTIQAA